MIGRLEFIDRVVQIASRKPGYKRLHAQALYEDMFGEPYEEPPLPTLPDTPEGWELLDTSNGEWPEGDWEDVGYYNPNLQEGWVTSSRTLFHSGEKPARSGTYIGKRKQPPKLVPFTQETFLASGARWVRRKGARDFGCILSTTDSGVNWWNPDTGSSHFSSWHLMIAREYSTDGLTWHPCGTEEAP